MTRHAATSYVLVGLALAGSVTLQVVPSAFASPVGECEAATSNQIEAGQCLRDTLGAAEQVLGIGLSSAQLKADAIDQIAGRSGARLALDQSQALWLQFRDSNCAVPGTFAAGGSGSGQFIISCQIEMTRARSAALEALAGGRAGGD